MLRSYSISGSERAGTFRVSIKRGEGAGSRYFHDQMKAGDLIDVSAPRGNFTLARRRESGDRVFVSAGIGATRRYWQCCIQLADRVLSP